MSQVKKLLKVKSTAKVKDSGVDAVKAGIAYQVKFGLRETGRLGGCMMELAQLAESGYSGACLVLVDPHLSTKAIRNAWDLSARVIRDDVLSRMRVVEVRHLEGGGRFVDGYPNQPTGEECLVIDEIVAQITEKPRGGNSQIAGNSTYEILRVLLVRWLTEESPSITISRLGEETGYSYRPVRQAIDKLSKHIVRSGNRGVALKSFPRSAWSRLVLESDSVRETIRYYAKGDIPRTPAAMLERFHRLPKESVTKVGIGGVEGARCHANDLDLIGMPRLDFTVHCPDGEPDLSFLRNLDPALEVVEDPMGPCSLMIHLLRRPRDYFFGGYADPVECLLDLREMRLDGQARQLLRSFPAAKSEDF